MYLNKNQARKYISYNIFTIQLSSRTHFEEKIVHFGLYLRAVYNAFTK